MTIDTLLQELFKNTTLNNTHVRDNTLFYLQLLDIVEIVNSNPLEFKLKGSIDSSFTNDELSYFISKIILNNKQELDIYSEFLKEDCNYQLESSTMFLANSLIYNKLENYKNVHNISNTVVEEVNKKKESTSVTNVTYTDDDVVKLLEEYKTTSNEIVKDINISDDEEYNLYKAEQRADVNRVRVFTTQGILVDKLLELLTAELTETIYYIENGNLTVIYNDIDSINMDRANLFSKRSFVKYDSLINDEYKRYLRHQFYRRYKHLISEDDKGNRYFRDTKKNTLGKFVYTYMTKSNAPHKFIISFRNRFYKQDNEFGFSQEPY